MIISKPAFVLDGAIKEPNAEQAQLYWDYLAEQTAAAS
jgi:hypothetical protein